MPCSTAASLILAFARMTLAEGAMACDGFRYNERQEIRSALYALRMSAWRSFSQSKLTPMPGSSGGTARPFSTTSGRWV